MKTPDYSDGQSGNLAYRCQIDVVNLIALTVYTQHQG